MFLVLGIVLVLVLPAPWGILSFVACLAIFAGELAFWHGRVRKQRVAVGGETLLGVQGTAITNCRPDGQVRLLGEIWEARCPDGAARGDAVVVTAREDLRLVVERAPMASEGQ